MRSVFLFIQLWVAGIAFAQSEYTTSVTFPAGYQIGDYIEFLKVTPRGAGESGYYEISISYTRGNIAAAATHIASISHANPNLWREVGKVNNNSYVSSGQYNFTIDCNTQSGNPRFRIRAVNTYGILTSPIIVYIKVRSINFNTAWTALSSTGNDLSVTKYLPMTDEWNLYVGKVASTNGANLAIKAINNGNVGIGTATPDEKLSVNGNIRAREIKVESTNWPDYVFEPTYNLPPLAEVKSYIEENRHLPGMPSSKEVEAQGIELGKMNNILTKKIEELTLYLIERDRQLQIQQKKLEEQDTRITSLTEVVSQLMKNQAGANNDGQKD